MSYDYALERKRRQEKWKKERAEREERERRERRNQHWQCQVTAADCFQALITGIAQGLSEQAGQYLAGKIMTALSRRHPYVQPVVAVPAISSLPAAEDPVQPRTYRKCDYPFPVGAHVRRLPTGKTISPEKLDAALENGFELMEGYTWVRSYIKGDYIDESEE